VLRKYDGDIAVDESGSVKSGLSNQVEVMIGYFQAWLNGMQIKGGADPSSTNGPQDVPKSMDALTKALQENTAATEKNSGATKTTKPVGGAASNAEEKY